MCGLLMFMYFHEYCLRILESLLIFLSCLKTISFESYWAGFNLKARYKSPLTFSIETLPMTCELATRAHRWSEAKEKRDEAEKPSTQARLPPRPAKKEQDKEYSWNVMECLTVLVKIETASSKLAVAWPAASWTSCFSPKNSDAFFWPELSFT